MTNTATQADLNACLSLRDERARQNAAARARCKADPELVRELSASARRCGASEIDWTEYFRNIGINYP